MQPADLVDSCHQLDGAYFAAIQEAQAREGGLVGWLGRFVRLPYEVREAANLPDSKVA